jgi:hypothetical protein
VCFPAVINAADVLHARSKGCLTSVPAQIPITKCPEAERTSACANVRALCLCLTVSASLDTARGREKVGQKEVCVWGGVVVVGFRFKLWGLWRAEKRWGVKQHTDLCCREGEVFTSRGGDQLRSR